MGVVSLKGKAVGSVTMPICVFLPSINNHRLKKTKQDILCLMSTFYSTLLLFFPYIFIKLVTLSA